MSAAPWPAGKDAQLTGQEIRQRLNGNHAARNQVALRAIPGDLSTIRRTRWAWQDWAPLGSFLLLAGEAGMGKGVLTCYLLANLTRGTMPGDLEGEPVNVLWVGFEDSWEEVVLPRLSAAGADVARVYRLEVETPGHYLDIMRDQVALDQLCGQHRVRVVAFEAIVDHLAAADDHKNAEVRRALAPVVELARARQLLAIGTTHLNKTLSGGFRHRVAGSGAYLAVCRVALLVHRHPDDRDKRVVALGKGNLGRVPDSFVFTIQGVEVPNPDDDSEVADVARIGDDPYFDSSLTVDDVLAGPAPDHGSREGDVVGFLRGLLADGPKRSTEIEEAAMAADLPMVTVKRHKSTAKVRSYRDGNVWWWALR
jgi:hypothetical protein